MVPRSHYYRVWLLLVIFAAPLLAQSVGAREELIRSGDVSLESAPLIEPPSLDKASTLAPPIHQDSFVQPATFTDTALAMENKTTSKKIIPLAKKHASSGEVERPKAVSPIQSLSTVGGSLAVVLGLFLSLAWVTRRGMPARIAKLPGEVIEVLGKAPLSKGQELQMVRIGSKLLLLCVTQHGSETLTEINDPEEVDRLATVCRKSSPQSVSATFDQMLHSMGREPARGFAEDPRVSAAREKTPSGGRRYA